VTRPAGVALVVALALAGLTAPPARAQAAGVFTGGRWAFVGDISPPTNETRGDDNATAELLTRLSPDGICTLGDNQYEGGAEAMFRAQTGFDGTYGRLVGAKIDCPTMGNHDMADGGTTDGKAPGFSSYFADKLTSLPCVSDPVPCHPEQGWYGIDLDANRDGVPDWYVVAVNTNCGRASGGTGDTGSPSCANDSPQVNWMRAFMAARHGGCCSGRKASILIGHHEPFGTCFFNDDRDSSGQLVTRFITQVWQHYHGDIGNFGHTHSTGRWGPLDWNGVYQPSGAGSRWFASGAGGRSLTPCRTAMRTGLRERNDTKYGVLVFTLTVAKDPAGWTGGTWTSQFFYVDGTTTPPAVAGIWP
jgi:hypothetical protein